MLSPFCVRPVTQSLGSKIPVKRTSILTPKKISRVESIEVSQAVAEVADLLRSETDACVDVEEKEVIVVDEMNLKVSPVRDDSEGRESQHSSVDSVTTFRSRASGASILQNYRPRSKANLFSNSLDKKNKDGSSDEVLSPAIFAATCLDFTSEELKREIKLSDARYNFKFLTYEKPAGCMPPLSAVDTVPHPSTSVLDTNKSLANIHQASSITWTSFSSPLSAAVPVTASAFTCTPIFRDSDPEESASFSPGIIPFSPDPKSARNEEPQEMSCTIFSPLSTFSPASTVLSADPSEAQNDDTSVLVQNENLLQDFYPSEISFFCGEVSDSAKKRLEEKSPTKLQTQLYRVDEKLFRENENSEYENISDLQKSIISQKSHQNGEKELFGNFDEEFDAELSMLWESATDDLLSETHSETDEVGVEAAEIEVDGQKKTVMFVFSRLILAVILTVLIYLTASVSIKISTWPVQQSGFTNFDQREFLRIRDDFLFHDQSMIPESFYSSFPDLFVTQDFTVDQNSLKDILVTFDPTDNAVINVWNEGFGSLGNSESVTENKNLEIAGTVDNLNDIAPEMSATLFDVGNTYGAETDVTEKGHWTQSETANTVIFSEPEHIENTAHSLSMDSNGEMTVMFEESSFLAEEKVGVAMQSSNSMEVSVFLFDSNSFSIQALSGRERFEESEEEDGEGEGEFIIIEVKEAEVSMEDISVPTPMERLEVVVHERLTEVEAASESESVEHTTTEDPSEVENPSNTENPLKLQNTIVLPEVSVEREEKEESVLEHENSQLSVSESSIRKEELIITESVVEIPQEMSQKSPSSPRFTVTPHGLFIGAGIFSVFSFFVILYFVVTYRDVTRIVIQENNFARDNTVFYSPEVQVIPKNVPQEVEIIGVDAAVDIAVGMSAGIAKVRFEEEENDVKNERKVKDKSRVPVSVRVTRNAAKNLPKVLLEEPSSSSVRRMSTRQRK